MIYIHPKVLTKLEGLYFNCTVCSFLTFYSFIIGKTILRSSKFEDIEIWNQQYVDIQNEQ